MTTTEELWIGEVTLGDIHPGFGTKHDGFGEINLGTELSSNAVNILEQLIRKKRTSVDSIIVVGKSLKVIAKPKAGAKRTVRELTKMTEGAMATLINWAASLAPGDISLCAGHALTDTELKAVMADHSSTSTFHGADRSV